MRQIELEENMRSAGIQRARAMMENNEEKGRADNNPYAQALYRRFLLPLIEVIKTAQEASGKPGRRAAHVNLLRDLEPATVAVLAVRCTLDHLMKHSHDDVRKIGRAIGVEVQRELALQVMQVDDPELLWAVQHDLDRRHSKNQRHRFNAIAGAAQNKGVTLLSWGPAEREQVGLWLIEQLRQLEMMHVEHKVERGIRGGVNTTLVAFLSEDCMTMIGHIKEAIELAMPFHLPCVEQPKDWVAFNDGGFHTNGMRIGTPYCLALRRASKAVIESYRSDPSSTESLRAGLSALQSVRWQINTEMLRAVEKISTRIDTEEILMQAEIPKPPRPGWLPVDRNALPKENMTPDQLSEFSSWKRELANWYTECKLRFTKWGRFGTAMRIARQFENEDELYFVYQADFRGRAYALTTGVSPQGSDLQKALLRFADGEPLDSTDAVNWFKVNGANKFGIDKVTHLEQIEWVDENAAFIIAIGVDPIANRGWLEADCPLQFLAWCQEFARYSFDPISFVSHLPVGLDGSCNGLQHFSAMLRDSVGGAATNLIPSEKPNDVYRQVANVVERKLYAENLDSTDERKLEYRRIWLLHGINRDIVKRSVMTLPYGSTRFSCSDYIVSDYLRFSKVPEFAREQYSGAANYLSFHVWDAIGEVVIAARDAMDWLQRSASQIIRKGESQISWVTPTGFRVHQVYQESDIMTVNSLLLGGVRIRIGTTSDKASVKGHRNGLSPNFVHSMDASHMTLTTLASKKAGIKSLAMIHDDYGTHARFAQQLFHMIRDEFVKMYESYDPLQMFKDNYEYLKPVPERGNLDLSLVRQSPYFFT